MPEIATKTMDELTEQDKQALYARASEWATAGTYNLVDAVREAAYHLFGITADPADPGVVTLQKLTDLPAMTPLLAGQLTDAAAIGRFYD